MPPNIARVFISRRVYSIIAAAVAGGIFPLALAPLHIYPLAVISLLILFALWSQCDHPFTHGYVYGLSLFAIGVNWIHVSLHQFGNMQIAVAIFFTALLISYLALFPAAAGWLAVRLCRHKKHTLLLAAPASLILFEWLRGTLFSGFPWLEFGFALGETPLWVWAPVFGLHGLSLLLAVISATFLSLILHKKKIYAVLMLLFISLSTIALSMKQWTVPVAVAPVSVSLIQGSIPQGQKWEQEIVLRTVSHYLTLSLEEKSADLLLWPETAIPEFYDRMQTAIQIVEESLPDSTLLITGIPYRKDKVMHNSILVAGEQHGFYHKQHLVPFGEYIPARSWLQPWLRRYQIPMSDFRPPAVVDQQSVFATRFGKIGFTICYEIAYSNIIRQALPAAEVLVTVSNDAWFGDTWAAHQHLQIARMRAMESGRFLLRATNDGITAIIDPQGRVIKRLPRFVAAGLHDEVIRYQGSTPFIYWGDAPVLILLLLSLLIILHRASTVK